MLPDLRDSDAPSLNEAVARAVADRLKDGKSVEFELTQAISERLLAWARTFGLLVGVPLALLATLLGILGIHSWSDFDSTVSQGKKDIQAKITAATTSAARLDVRARRLDAQARQLDAQYGELKRRFGDVTQLASEVEGLAGKVDKIEERIQFKGAFPSGAAAQGEVERTINDYRSYLKSLGYRPAENKLSFVIDKGTVMNAYFDGSKQAVAPEIAAMPDI